MPSWPIHVALAHKFNKKLNLGDDFILGNVLPDVLDGFIFEPSNITDKNLSHFRINGRINYDLFLKNYGDKLDNPIVLGYFVHLLVDWFYNMHTAKNHFVDNGVLLSDRTILDKDEKTLFMKQSEYNQYGHVLFKNNLLGHKININDKSLENIKELRHFKYSNSDLAKTLNVINSWICGNVINKNISYKTHTKEELDKLFDDCYLYVTNYLEKIKEAS